MKNYKRETIRKHLADMMYDTSVKIVIISPDMRESEWIGLDGMGSFILPKKLKEKLRCLNGTAWLL